jgi:hypothetical protein
MESPPYLGVYAQCKDLVGTGRRPVRILGSDINFSRTPRRGVPTERSIFQG